MNRTHLRRVHRRGAAQVTVLGALLTLLVTMLPSGTASAASNLLQLFQWYPGSRLPTATVVWPDWLRHGELLPAARFDVRLGLSQTDPTRVPEKGESFYLRVTFAHIAANDVMSFNAVPMLKLPPGLVRADNQLPVRCAGILPPQTAWVEYVRGCSVAAEADGTLTVLSNAGVGVAPAFRVIQGTQWIWDIPVRATSALNFADLTVQLLAKEKGVRTSITTLSAKVFSGDPRSPIWNYYKAAPRTTTSRGVLLDQLGYPNGPEMTIPWKTDGVIGQGTVQDFQNDPTVRTITSSPTFGTHEIAIQFRDTWNQRASVLGPASAAAGWDRSYSTFTQQFGGGRIRYSDMSGTITVTTLCVDIHSMNC